MTPTQTMNRVNWKKHLANWKLFATASGASLGAGTAADADIVYSTGLNTTFSAPVGQSIKGTFSISGNPIGVKIRNSVDSQFYVVALTFKQTGVIHPFVSKPTTTAYLKHFASGAAITGGAFLTKFDTGKLCRKAQGNFYGPFAFGTTGFVGVTINNGLKGWIKVKVGSYDIGGTNPTALTILGWAYNDALGSPINAGQTTNAVPEPGTMALGLLASGAGGLVALRRAKKHAQDEQATA